MRGPPCGGHSRGQGRLCIPPHNEERGFICIKIPFNTINEILYLLVYVNGFISYWIYIILHIYCLLFLIFNQILLLLHSCNIYIYINCNLSIYTLMHIFSWMFNHLIYSDSKTSKTHYHLYNLFAPNFSLYIIHFFSMMFLDLYYKEVRYHTHIIIVIQLI